jgi:hypothetical protein
MYHHAQPKPDADGLGAWSLTRHGSLPRAANVWRGGRRVDSSDAPAQGVLHGRGVRLPRRPSISASGAHSIGAQDLGAPTIHAIRAASKLPAG